MKKFYLILIVLLSACSAQPAAPTATSTPEATSTATQLPTATVTPAPTISPELIDMQDEIAGNTQNFTLNMDGTLEYKGVTYKGFTLVGDQWEVELPDGKMIYLNPKQVEMNDEDGLIAEGVIYNSETGWDIYESDLKLVENAGTRLENYVYKGVTINGGYLLHQSLLEGSPRISDLKFRPEAVAELLARTVFADWWTHGPLADEHKGKDATDADFEKFMQLWSKAQKGDPSVSCSDLEVDSFSNDLATPGYKQDMVKKRYLCDDGTAGDDTIVLNEINVVAVNNGDYETIENITNVGKWFGVGMGANYQGDNMYWYIGLGFGAAAEANDPIPIASASASLPKYVAINKGATYVADYKYNKHLFEVLRKDLEVGK